MIEKTRIVEQIGETAVLLPGLVRDGLIANDRAKIRMSAMQAAVRHATAPTEPTTDLSIEARAAGLDTGFLQQLINGARAVADRILIPGVGALLSALAGDVEAMLAAVKMSNDEDAADLRRRIDALGSTLSADSDQLSLSQIAAANAVTITGPDSIHRLVMDLHKALNRAAMNCVDAVIAGAHTFGLMPGDHLAIEAFMRGVEQTRRLKFDHPGLETTAVRSGEQLIIQNDIGTTDAHVLVIKVEGQAITVTYTDVHRARAKFFVGMLKAFQANWTGLDRQHADGLGDDGDFFLITGRFASRHVKLRESFLEAVGFALVFLIDWNKARKMLRQFVDNANAVRLIDWAARRRLGHRAFLQLGGTDLVTAAIRRVASTRIGYGVRLDAALGREGAIDFLKAVMRIATEGLLAGRANRLIYDAIDAELGRRLDRTESELLQGIVRQAGLAREIAANLADLINDHLADRSNRAAAIAEGAKRIEAKADCLVVELRGVAQRVGSKDRVAPLIDTMEAAVDDLEDAVFMLSLAPPPPSHPALAPLAALCEMAVAGAEAVARAADAAATVPDGNRADVDDALEAVSALVELEHAADRSERDAVAALVTDPRGGPGLLALLECVRKVETATDRFAHAGLFLRDHVICDLVS